MQDQGIKPLARCTHCDYKTVHYELKFRNSSNKVTGIRSMLNTSATI